MNLGEKLLLQILIGSQSYLQAQVYSGTNSQALFAGSKYCLAQGHGIMLALVLIKQFTDSKEQPDLQKNKTQSILGNSWH